ncbi:ADP-ribosylglycohydrolase family protein [Methanosarcina horonobensis]|uniref:ADP-ribosylglycohydrolase family protein n=1 Tax=Methanosarcina horonobensis TaxID=418008 RepID=UPI000AC72BCE|nr:ADP-ribosylglycohydrolase family protein [Methanosarcina horonobensis]
MKLALDGVAPKDMFLPLLQVTEGISEEFTEALKGSYELAYSNLSDEEAIPKIGQGWYADETFALAYFCILRSPDNYKKSNSNRSKHNRRLGFRCQCCRWNSRSKAWN